MSGIVIGVSFFSNMFVVSEINVVRNDFFVPTEQIEKAMGEVISKNIFFVDTGAWERKLRGQFPIAKTIRVNRMLPRAIQVKLESYEIVATITQEHSEKLFLLAENGVVVQDSDVVHNGNPRSDALLHVEVPLYDYDHAKAQVLQPKVLLQDGRPFMSREQVEVIAQTIDLYNKNMPMKISYVEFLPLVEEIHIHTEQGAEILFWLREEMETQLYKLNWKLHETTIDITADNVAYIDLRIPDRVDVCLNTDPCAKYVGKAL